ncbi:MAG: TlpA disulfide reductase family protein [Pyrinomonadaceae bacterium]
MNTIKGYISILALTMMLAAAAFSQTVLTSPDGSRIDVDAQRGKVVVLAIGAAWLPLSAKQAEITNALAKKYSGKDVVLYFVATDSTNAKSKNFASDADVRSFATDNKLSVSVLRDSDGSVMMRKYQIEQVPSFVILDKQGKPAGEPFGGIDPKFDLAGAISRVIDKLL